MVRVSASSTRLLEGDSVDLRCSYPATHAKLTLLWKHTDEAGNTHIIWSYMTDRDQPNLGEDKYIELLETPVSHEHGIRLKKAMIRNEGTYTCHIETYGGKFIDQDDDIFITIIGGHYMILSRMLNTKYFVAIFEIYLFVK